MTGMIQTVLGKIEPGELGITQTHEHLVTDLIDYFEMPEEASERSWVDAPVTMDRLGGLLKRFMTNRDNLRLIDESEALEGILKYRHAGGGGLVDTSNIGLGRDPLALARISRATGLNIIMGASWYVPLSYPPELAGRSEEDLAAEIVCDQIGRAHV